jgi:hypothetical protein
MSLWRIARDVVHSMDITAAVGPERLREIMADLVDRASTSNTNGTLSTTVTQHDAKASGWGCGWALAARNNVVIDVNNRSANPADTDVNIANQIAAKVHSKGGCELSAVASISSWRFLMSV